MRHAGAVLSVSVAVAGVLVWAAAAALPFLLPLAAVILSSVPRDSTPAGTGERERAAATV